MYVGGGGGGKNSTINWQDTMIILLLASQILGVHDGGGACVGGLLLLPPCMAFNVVIIRCKFPYSPPSNPMAPCIHLLKSGVGRCLILGGGGIFGGDIYMHVHVYIHTQMPAFFYVCKAQ